MIIIMKAIYVVLVLCTIAFAENFTLFKSEDPSAKCLDGSPAALYFQPGTSSDKFLIFFEGGGLCRGDGFADTIQYCYKRSFTNLGSSKDYLVSRSFDSFPFLTPDSRINPFHTWNRVFIPYCDGFFHAGSRADPVQHMNRLIFFRGHNNTLAHFGFLDKQFAFFSASSIVLTGTSAGAVTSTIWGNYIFEKAKNPKGVLIMPDSGTVIVDFPNLYNNKTMADYTAAINKIALTQIQFPISECANLYPSQTECFQLGNLYQFIKPRVFLLQSQYDSWGLIEVIQLKCVPNVRPSNLAMCNDTERAHIERYRAKINEAMQNFTYVEKNGVWSISCVQHGFLDDSLLYVNSHDYRAPADFGKTILAAIMNFINGTGKKYIDDADWPYNIGCNGLRKNRRHLIESTE